MSIPASFAGLTYVDSARPDLVRAEFTYVVLLPVGYGLLIHEKSRRVGRSQFTVDRSCRRVGRAGRRVGRAQFTVAGFCARHNSRSPGIVVANKKR